MRVTQFSLLSALEKYGDMTVTDLAHVLGSDATSMSRALGAIVAHGWVIVGPGKDKRSKSVSLTKAGLEALKGAKPYWQDAQQQLVRVVGAERRAQLESLVDQVFNEISGT
jgi:DNA-binding MarR family transcriptional regulator